jgi:hypothetical protein
MAEVVLKDVQLYMAGKEFSNNLSQVNLNLSVDLQDRTGFGSSGRQRLAGLKDVDVSINGYWDAGSSTETTLGSTDFPDETLFADVGSTNEVWTALPIGNTVGNPGYSFITVSADYQPGASIGDVLSFTVAASGDGGTILRGSVIGSGAISSSGSYTPVEIGAITSSENAYAALHALDFSSSGSSMTVNVVTDNTSGMGAASTMFTFTINSSDDNNEASMLSTGGSPTSGDTWWSIETVAGSTGDTANILLNAGKK